MAGELNVVVTGNGTVSSSRVTYVAGSKVSSNERRPKRLLFSESENNLKFRAAENYLAYPPCN